MVDPNSELFRAKQQVIYYRAEIAQFKNKISELERLVEKEVLRNKYLQAKVRELNGEKIVGLHEEIQRLRKRVMELEVELEESKTLSYPINEIKKEQADIYSYFNYTVILPTGEESTISIYGDYTIVNQGNVSIDDLVICIKMKPLGAFTLSAKILDPKLLHGQGVNRTDIEWVYAVNDWRERILRKGEYWIKNSLPEQDKKIKFSFEIMVDQKSSDKAKIIAEVYKGKNISKAINNIVIQ